jgi:hypothetical protein
MIFHRFDDYASQVNLCSFYRDSSFFRLSSLRFIQHREFIFYRYSLAIKLIEFIALLNVLVRKTMFLIQVLTNDTSSFWWLCFLSNSMLILSRFYFFQTFIFEIDSTSWIHLLSIFTRDKIDWTHCFVECSCS